MSTASFEQADSSSTTVAKNNETRSLGQQLSSEDVVELTSFSHKKDDIDQKIRIASAWPDFDAFSRVSTYADDSTVLPTSKSALETFGRELGKARLQREQLEAAVQQFDVHEMTRLRTVAKGKL